MTFGMLTTEQKDAPSRKASEIFGIVSALALLALLGLSKQPIPRSAMPDGSPPLKRIAAGLRYVRPNPTLAGVMWIFLVMNFSAYPYLTISPSLRGMS